MGYLDIPSILDFETQTWDLPEVELRLASSRKYSSAELRLAVSLVAYRIKRLGLAPSDGLRIFGGAPVFRSLIEPSFVDPFATAMTNLTFSLTVCPERLCRIA
jgi:hypothetical protein